MRTIPNMTVIVPADEKQTKEVIYWAKDYKGPAYIRLGRSGVDDTTPADYSFELGKALQLRDGKDLTIIACGSLVPVALAAAEALASKNIEARVLNMASIKPLDTEAVVAAAKETGAIVTAEEHNIIGGLGAAVAEAVTAVCPVPVMRTGIQDTFGESGTPKELMAKYGLTAEAFTEAAERALQCKKAGEGEL